jgi:serine/threonine-protein kinase RsbW
MIAQTDKQTIRLISQLESVILVEKLIDDLRDQLDFKDDFYGNILVSVSEAVKNAIEHGNNNDPDKVVLLSYEMKDGFLTFTVSDEGKGFEFHKLPDPTLPENIEKITGRGIFFMHQLSDGISYENNGSTVKLVFRLA